MRRPPTAGAREQAIVGIPSFIKDIFARTVRTSCGSRSWTTSSHLRRDGGVTPPKGRRGQTVLGKATDEFAMGSSNETSYYGPSRTGSGKVPGALMAVARLAAHTTGTDTGGSIRRRRRCDGRQTDLRSGVVRMIAFASVSTSRRPPAPR